MILTYFDLVAGFAVLVVKCSLHSDYVVVD